MKRTVVSLVAVVALLVALTVPAAAHNLKVTPPGTDEVVEGWVGTDLDVLGGTPIFEKHPDPFTLFAPHGSGLIAACEGTESSPAVDIRGPGGPGCPHGS